MTETSSARTAPPRGEGLLVQALVGGVLTVVLAFVPLSPVLGGGAAGYLRGRDGLRVGALAGLLAAIPVVGVVLLFVALLVPVVTMPGGAQINPLAGFSLAGLVLFLLVGLYTVGLGALGGYLGVYLRESRVVPTA